MFHITALATVDRKLFVPPELAEDAYLDLTITLVEGSHGPLVTISQPSLVAKMIEYLHLTEKKRVLEIGTGSGWNAALMSKLCQEVITVECVPEMVETSSRILHDLGINNVQVFEADGAYGAAQCEIG